MAQPRVHNKAPVPSLFVFAVIAPEGALHAHFELEPGRCYGPGDVQVERGAGGGPAPHRLTVTATCLPAEMDFRRMAARAATRSANVPQDPLLQLLHLLIPF